MSYCRWSSDDFQCDVYVYEDAAGGWTTHVARRRHVYNQPLPDAVPIPDSTGMSDQMQAFIDRHLTVMNMVSEAELVDIGLPHAGETFNDDTPGECAERLMKLRDIGYWVPQYAIDELMAEHQDSHTTHTDSQ